VTSRGCREPLLCSQQKGHTWQLLCPIFGTAKKKLMVALRFPVVMYMYLYIGKIEKFHQIAGRFTRLAQKITQSISIPIPTAKKAQSPTNQRFNR
jgi:hypothetical protein